MKMLTHLEFVDDFAYSERNLVLAFEGALFPLRGLGDLFQLLFCSFEKFAAFTGTFFGQHGVSTYHQSLPRVGRVSDLGKVLFIKQRKLKRTTIHEFTNLGGPKGCYP